jgi:hypothetical protein
MFYLGIKAVISGLLAATISEIASDFHYNGSARPAHTPLSGPLSFWLFDSIDIEAKDGTSWLEFFCLLIFPREPYRQHQDEDCF